MTNNKNGKDNPDFEALLEYLRRVRGFDFSGYKRASLVRRIRVRMHAVHIENFRDYIDYLEVHPDEFIALFNTILINVTAFFRDSAAWEYIAREVLPRIIAKNDPSKSIRCWCAGCASGEEAYTLAMLLAEQLGEEAFRQRVKIYATDVDEDALACARNAVYSEDAIAPVPEELRNKYFEKTDSKYMFRNDLRRLVIFGRHDLIQDAPISRLDLLVCRNTLMYFNAETQTQILSRFHFALNPDGHLFLGKAEMLLSRTKLFVPEEIKYRIFVKTQLAHFQNLLLPATPTASADVNVEEHVASPCDIVCNALEVLPVSLLTVDRRGVLALANREARELFKLDSNDIGRMFRDLEISYRPAEIRSVIDRINIVGKPIKVDNVEWRNPRSGKTGFLNVHAVPVHDAKGNLIAADILFFDVTSVHEMQEEIRNNRQELETVNAELHSANEEMETSNEELQSTVEELQTTNEELQSTNEEMETMNEELAATNEELAATNEELRTRTEEADQANAFLQSILTGIRAGVIVIDRQYLVQSWNRKAEDLWGMRGDEVLGQSFFNLDIGLPIEKLRPLVRKLLSGEPATQEEIIEAVNRRGRKFRCHVTGAPLRGVRQDISGGILLMEDRDDPSVEK